MPTVVRKYGSQCATSKEEVLPDSISMNSNADSSAPSTLTIMRTYAGKSMPERIVEFSSLDEFRSKIEPDQEKEEQPDQGQAEAAALITQNENEPMPALPCEPSTINVAELEIAIEKHEPELEEFVENKQKAEESEFEDMSPTAACPNCGKPVKQKTSGRGQRKIFCSRECKNLYSYKNRDSRKTKIVPCEFCGKKFVYYHRNDMAKAYCSVACAKQAILGVRKDGDK